MKEYEDVAHELLLYIIIDVRNVLITLKVHIFILSKVIIYLTICKKDIKS